ncbi:unnamed protein product [Caenorhabditis bovis]|uniref:Elongin-C n=1 Tax=Caenorhabditis bovis TaxID=2654633 RepID=A0A8S1ESZ7_9PELO|nr:unnamed protein product [Caenorhabditis bovis]
MAAHLNGQLYEERKCVVLARKATTVTCGSWAVAKFMKKTMDKVLKEDNNAMIDTETGKQKFYGGIEGPTSEYVKLVSSDQHEFIIRRELALTSGTIRAMLSGPGVYAENESNVVYFREIPSHVLQKVCQYFAYKVRYSNAATEIPEFNIPPEVALELLMAANFLDC